MACVHDAVNAHKSGKMTMSGSRNKIWRVRDMNTPRRALPIELKKLEVTG